VLLKAINQRNDAQTAAVRMLEVQAHTTPLCCSLPTDGNCCTADDTSKATPRKHAQSQNAEPTSLVVVLDIGHKHVFNIQAGEDVTTIMALPSRDSMHATGRYSSYDSR
jgi:hypothetical protein